MIIKTVPVSLFDQNARLISDEETGETLVVDPGGDVETLVELIEPEDKVSILMTHAHLDHVGGVAKLIERLTERSGNKPKLYGHEAEKEMRARVAEQGLMFGLPAGEFENAPEPDNFLVEGDTVAIGNYQARVLFTPGHSPGHLSLVFDEVLVRHQLCCKLSGNVLAEDNYQDPVLIAGDTLFSGSIGRTDLPGGDFETLIDSIKSKLLVLPDNTRVLPGHGPDTTIAIEKADNPFLQ